MPSLLCFLHFSVLCTSAHMPDPKRETSPSQLKTSATHLCCSAQDPDLFQKLTNESFLMRTMTMLKTSVSSSLNHMLSRSVSHKTQICSRKLTNESFTTTVLETSLLRNWILLKLGGHVQGHPLLLVPISNQKFREHFLHLYSFD